MAPGQSNFVSYLSDMKACHTICLYVRNAKCFGYLKSIFSEMAFRISFRISEMLFGFVMTRRLIHIAFSPNMLHFGFALVTIFLTYYFESVAEGNHFVVVSVY